MRDEYDFTNANRAAVKLTEDPHIHCPIDEPMNDLPPLPAPRLGRYRHYKGGEYEVVGVARHSETLEPLVLYRPRYGEATLWVRPYAMFFESIDVDGRVQPRFAPLR